MEGYGKYLHYNNDFHFQIRMESSSDDDFLPQTNEEKERDRRKRQERSDRKLEENRRINRERVAKHRANRSLEATQSERLKNADRIAKNRAQLSQSQRAAERQSARVGMQQLRKSTKVKPYDGIRNIEILKGDFTVKKLEDTIDSIGTMTHECSHCGALKFAKETSSTCCLGGKVSLDPFPKPPDEVMKLWQGKDPRSNLFRDKIVAFSMYDIDPFPTKMTS